MKAKINTVKKVGLGCFTLTFNENELHGNGKERTAFFNRAEFLELAGSMEWEATVKEQSDD